MIEGLHFDVKAGELALHLQDREHYHTSRASWYRDQAEAMKEGNPDFEGVSGSNPLETLQNKADQHTQKAETFLFMRNHLQRDEVYRLSKAELVDLEMISGRSYW